MIATIVFFALITALIIQIIFIFNKNGKPDPVSPWILIASAAGLLVDLVQRSIKIKFVAMTNTFESLVFFSMCLLIVLFVYALKGKEKAFPMLNFGGTFVAMLLLAIASSPIAPKEALSPIPALQSNWLVLHVSLAFVGEAFFAVSFVASIYYLMTKDEDKKKNLDKLIYTTITIGYPIFTAGALIFGAIWASYAWGRFWGWDPKETWALITWLTYTGYLHARFVAKLRGKLLAIISVVGFLFTLFTFFGVNFLLSGLHSYG